MRVKIIARLFVAALLIGGVSGITATAQNTKARARRAADKSAAALQTPNATATPLPTPQLPAQETAAPMRPTTAPPEPAAINADDKSEATLTDEPLPAAAPQATVADNPTTATDNAKQDEEEAAIVAYYNNFFTSYRLGPEDVISVTVFDQPRYSKTGIVVPPDGVISYYLIPDGIKVVGKTVVQVQQELTKKLDEFIIDPKVTVTIDKAQSARYAVLGDVGAPGVKIMSRRVSVLDAIAEAGGVARTGDKAKVFILRRQASGELVPIAINLKDYEKGKTREIVYLIPGDQVYVPNRTSKLDILLKAIPVISFARLFATGGF